MFKDISVQNVRSFKHINLRIAKIENQYFCLMEFHARTKMIFAKCRTVWCLPVVSRIVEEDPYKEPTWNQKRSNTEEQIEDQTSILI